ncbi:DUF1697 domain-containing protein [Acuticoccus kandeliae]|uniref:DUF1697 domain-containing protein n=1 Tax=Acuticoccus kandeliae TaxID=2073160 RepID=UPI000D3E789E|nr:DUF1697 domain-containing protein [Acuticoccus kandeliae]
MATFIVLLRGINVGGRGTLAMKDFRALLEGLSYEGVATYIQSGNAVFAAKGKAAAVERAVGEAIEAAHGFRPDVIAMELGAFAKAAAANPYGETDPGRVHAFFLAEKPKNPDLAALAALAAGDEAFTLTDRVFFLHAPGGIGRSKLAAKAERALGVPTTARNMKTVAAILALAEGVPG